MQKLVMNYFNFRQEKVRLEHGQAIKAQKLRQEQRRKRM